MDEGFEIKGLVGPQKVRTEIGLIGLLILAVIGLTALEINVVRLGSDIPLSTSILFFSLININAILLIFMAFLVLRNLYRFFFVSQNQLVRAKLRTKLVVAFISLSLGPTLLLFFTSLQFITTSHDYWFNTNVEQSLEESLNMGDYFMELNKQYALDYGKKIKNALEDQTLFLPGSWNHLKTYLEVKRQEYNLSQIEIFSPDFKPIITVRSPEIAADLIPVLGLETLKTVIASKRPTATVDPTASGDIIRVVQPLTTGENRVVGLMSISYFHPLQLSERLETISQGLYGYRQLKAFKDPIKISHYITLTIVTLVIIFAATWFGFHLAESITGPITDLAEGTKRLATGDYDFSVEAQSRDEIGTLVDSFNRMTKDLKAHKTELTQKNIELTQSYSELDQRRRYMEIVLQNVAAGVVSTDAEGKITTVNSSAEEILGIKADQILGRHYGNLLAGDHQAIIDDLLRAARVGRRGSAEKQVWISIGERFASLLFHLSLLKDEHNNDMGLVLVFDDMTELEKAQRMAAWREVARRIAHEIKNPLTPIQLSAQRLRRRYADRLGDDEKIFDESIRMIIRQVQELKGLVNEFSNFARMPAANPTPNDLAEIVEETLVLYKEGHPDIEFAFSKSDDLPVFNLDREQIKRVLINLLDNAVTAVNNHGRIEISLRYNKDLEMARLEMTDNGTGISPKDKARLFDPYFSTKKTGTGLGLAIVSTIIADHNGFIRFQSNQPQGTKFIIELPIKT